MSRISNLIRAGIGRPAGQWRLRCWLALGCLIGWWAASPLATATSSNPATGGWHWRQSDRFRGFGELGPSVLAADEGGGRLAVGDEDGVLLGPVVGPPPQRVARVREVRDLHFSADGALWIGARTGLWRFSEPHLPARVENRSPGTGEASRSINRIARAGELLAVATANGAFVSRDGRSWRRLDAGFPSGAIQAIALGPGPGPDQAEVFALAGQRLWRASISHAGTGVVVEDVGQVSLGGAPTGEVPVDVLVGPVRQGASERLYVVYSRALMIRHSDREQAPEGWRLLRPVLPPGARLRRVVEEGEALWLVSDRGLLRAETLWQSFNRTSSPAGASRAVDLVALRGRLFAATHRGVLEAEWLAAGGSTSRGGTAPAPVRAPDIQLVQRAALRYLSLGNEGLHRARSGLANRGWLPVLGLRFGADRSRGRRWDNDQTFVSGDTRFLRDEDGDRSLDLDASITLAWDLGDTLYNPEVVDLSRETRLIIALRDDVMDEINQLYFERLGLLRQLADLERRPWPGPEPMPAASLAQSPPVSPTGLPNRLRLELRVGELTAGLDAWTGGWFSEEVERLRMVP